MQIDIKKEVAALTAETIATRRDIHAHPELGFHEFRTGKLVETRLKALGLRVRRCADPGVIGVLEGGKPGKTVMLRAELDALPLTEKNDLPFCSQNPGVMHACGHDCHAAIQLSVAKILTAHREELPGTVVFLFQPNEEDIGAPQMIAEGALKDPRPDAIFDMHVWSPIPIGKVGMVSGPDCASSYYFKLTIHGKGTAAYIPDQGISPIDAAGHVLNAINAMQTLEYSTLNQPTLITVGTIHAGDYMINIPDDLTMEGSIRCLHSNEKAVHERFTELVTAVCTACRCSCDVDITCGNNMLENDPDLYSMAHSVASEVVGKENITDKGVREMGGDDLAEFFREGIPGIYYLAGMGNPAKHTTAPHHSRNFRVDEDVLDLGVELQTRMTLRYLGAI
ncbi:MAG: amidohydrolase [Oscillibacter sp.]|jgi:amidohydrolase|nr:amidohydrolase [Oscillibacter sp.]